jgi:TonB family protein
MDAVSQILDDRRVDASGLERMLGTSLIAHLMLLAIVALVPAGWLGSKPADAERVVMVIGLSAPIGPKVGGMTAISAKPIQQVRPVEEKKAIEPVRPPAAAEPEMVVPTKVVPKKQEAPVKTKVPDAKSKTPTKGEETQRGTAIAETHAKGAGFGLTTSGGGTGAQLDVGDFCCPEYLATMQDLINRNWSSKSQGDGTAIMKFTIQRNGMLTDIQLERSSGQGTLDFLSQRALLLTKQLPPLPAAFNQPSLTVHLTFEYHR